MSSPIILNYIVKFMVIYIPVLVSCNGMTL